MDFGESAFGLTPSLLFIAPAEQASGRVAENKSHCWHNSRPEAGFHLAKSAAPKPNAAESIEPRVAIEIAETGVALSSA